MAESEPENNTVTATPAGEQPAAPSHPPALNEWEKVFNEIEDEIRENLLPPIPQIEEPEHSPEPRTLTERIKADPELCAVLERRPKLCRMFEMAAARLDAINGSVNEYLAATPQGFEKMMWALVQLEIEYGPDGRPVITPSGHFAFKHLDEKQRSVFERFLCWQRQWYLWPQLEHQIRTATEPGWNEENRRRALEAIAQTSNLLREHFPQSAGVC